MLFTHKVFNNAYTICASVMLSIQPRMVSFKFVNTKGVISCSPKLLLPAIIFICNTGADPEIFHGG